MVFDLARPAGFEPTVFRVGVENVIHCTTAAGNPYIIARGRPKGKKNIGEAWAVPALRQPSAAREVGKTGAARSAPDCDSGGGMTLRGKEL